MFKQTVRFVGRKVSADGYTMDPAEIAPVQALKEKTPYTVGGKYLASSPTIGHTYLIFPGWPNHSITCYHGLLINHHLQNRQEARGEGAPGKRVMHHQTDPSAGHKVTKRH